MSSDSDDDYSYTNSVSVLKALTKKDMSIGSDIDTSKNEVNFFDTSEIESPKPLEVPKPRSRRIEQQTIEVADEEPETINLDYLDADDSLIKITKNNNDSCVILSDEDCSTPVNIISAIDDVLQTKSQRKRGRKKTAPRQTRQSKRLRKELNVISNVKDVWDVSMPEPRQTRQSSRRKKSTAVVSNNSLLNISTDICIVDDTPEVNEINYEVTVKVYWKSQNLEKFTMRRFDKLAIIFKYFSEKENISENRLLFTIKDKIVSKNDTPNGLNITAATIIEGGILSEKSDLADSKTQDELTIEFKVQTRDRKHPMLISLKPEDKMEVLMCQCAQELGIPMKSLKFYFDGDLIKPSDTPETLDLEGGEIIDCIRL